MKAVMISIQPKWVELIASGKKTIEVRKTRPKIDTPFKCYIYCTKASKKYQTICGCMVINTDELYRLPNGKIKHDWSGELMCCNGEYSKDNFLNGKVIGEFVCDRIEDFYCASVPYQKENNLGYGHFVDNGVYKVDGWFEGVVFERNDRYIDSMLKNKDLDEMRLSAQELFDYIGIGKYLYAWHISDLVIYDKPRDISEFYSTRWDMPCENKKRGFSMDFCMAYPEGSHFCKELNCDKKRLKNPPKSWCYVEEKEN